MPSPKHDAVLVDLLRIDGHGRVYLPDGYRQRGRAIVVIADGIAELIGGSDVRGPDHRGRLLVPVGFRSTLTQPALALVHADERILLFDVQTLGTIGVESLP